ncbi:MAG: ParB/RepB/Spo0J family partition protein [Natronospirillum sp.]|uniref:ParB/RepB/Spo0J family partition protein n=1 Tax=Natronospirillum sp. TaxID=2812955 RepID=UPI0025E41A29|nr:ParB/RepB/Spo0J family partition protein [Natronospirillum sp.]MCH8552508.1 ParB/RepB/Spo0J family partition protein [Natronospirillum sp.]
MTVAEQKGVGVTIDGEVIENRALMTLGIDELVPAPWGNFRLQRDPGSFAELKESIRAEGINQNLVVRPVQAQGGWVYQVLAGYGRWEAAKDVGLAQVPVMVRLVDDRQAKNIMLAENAVREDLNDAVLIEQYAALVGNFDGDFNKAAEFLGVSESKLRRYVQLKNCHEGVLTALANKLIHLGHAEILSQLATDEQKRLLDRVIVEGLSVKELRDVAARVQVPLSYARFDKADCVACPHNSEVQQSLFDSGVAGGLCGNSECFKAKSGEWFRAHLAELESDHATVIGENVKPVSDTQRIDAVVLGDEHVKNECAGCAHNAVIVSTALKTFGDCTEGRCTNQECFDQAKEAYRLATGPEASAGAEQSHEVPAPEATPAPASQGATNPPAKKKTTAKATPKKQLNYHAKIQRVAAARYLKDHREAANLDLVFAVAGAINAFPGNFDGKLEGDLESVQVTCSIPKLIEVCSRMSREQLEETLAKVSDLWVEQATSKYGGEDLYSDGVFQQVNKMARGGDGSAAYYIDAWQPSEESLSVYTKAELEIVLSEAVEPHESFRDFYERTHGKGAFKKLMAMKSKERLEAILSCTDFNWAGFAPRPYLTDNA